MAQDVGKTIGVTIPSEIDANFRKQAERYVSIKRELGLAVGGAMLAWMELDDKTRAKYVAEAEAIRRREKMKTAK